MNTIRGLRSASELAAPAAALPASRPVQAHEAPALEAPAAALADSVSFEAPEAPAEAAACPEPAAPAQPAVPSQVDGFLLAETPAASQPEVSLPAGSTVPPDLAPDADSRAVAGWCYAVAKADLPVKERTLLIAPVLSAAVARAESPSPEWVKATPQQVTLFVQETLEHTDAVQRIGGLRGQDWSRHDFEDGVSKFRPEIAQFLAKPGRDESVQWAIGQHNGAGHHNLWANPKATTEELSESASDIVNAWRMNRRVYDKPSWSWERITRFIEVGFQNNEMTVSQRDALLTAIPYQMEEESRHGLPT